MIVIDASALADILAPTAVGASLGGFLQGSEESLHAPDLIDAETVSALRGLERGGDLAPESAAAALGDLTGFGVTRHPHRPLLGAAWELRHNLTIYDALYVALTGALGARLLTTDAAMAAAVGKHSSVELVSIQ